MKVVLILETPSGSRLHRLEPGASLIPVSSEMTRFVSKSVVTRLNTRSHFGAELTLKGLKGFGVGILALPGRSFPRIGNLVNGNVPINPFQMLMM